MWSENSAALGMPMSPIIDYASGSIQGHDGEVNDYCLGIDNIHYSNNTSPALSGGKLDRCASGICLHNYKVD